MLSLVSGCSHREQRDPIYLRDKVTQRHSKEQFEAAQKVEQEYSRYFTGRCAWAWSRELAAGKEAEAFQDSFLSCGEAHAAYMLPSAVMSTLLTSQVFRLQPLASVRILTG